MFTSVDKAIAAIFGGIVTVASMVFGVEAAWATPELIAAVGSVITTVLVYAVPNKTATPATPAEPADPAQ